MAAEGVAPDPALAGSALVDRLRRDELDSIASEVAAGRREHILKTLDERGRAQELVRQQFTGRYPFELLQNANDASGDETTRGHTARFVLTDSALLVADMGGGFGPEQIRAICGLGRSSKDPRKSIGPLRVDVNVGDPVTPAPQRVAYPALLDEPFELIGYPIETVLAEKLVTMIALGDTTTRERDFADVLLLTDTHAVDAARLSQAIAATAAHRDTTLRPVHEATAGLGARRQADWQRYLARAGLADRLPDDYTTAIDRIAAFADPIQTGSAASGRWQHTERDWKT